VSTIVSTSPQRPDDVVGEWADAGVEGAERAIGAAGAAAEDWRRLTAHERGAALQAAADRLRSRADELTDLVIREVGKSVAEARGEVARTVAILRFYSQAALDAEGDVLPPSAAGTLLYTRRRPRGVVGLITPWNFPRDPGVEARAGAGVRQRRDPQAVADGHRGRVRGRLAVRPSERRPAGRPRRRAGRSPAGVRRRPFGGEKVSSIGPREQGRAAREFYTSTSTLTVFPP
jgi:acyl-CoA reductase-like NAD-dependent aldehyde dehydrogenase